MKTRTLRSRYFVIVAALVAAPMAQAAPTAGETGEPRPENFPVLLTKPGIECVREFTPARYTYPGSTTVDSTASSLLCPVPVGPALAELDEIDHLRVYIVTNFDVWAQWCVASVDSYYTQYDVICSPAVATRGGGLHTLHVERPAGVYTGPMLSTLRIYGSNFTVTGYSYMAPAVR